MSTFDQFPPPSKMSPPRAKMECMLREALLNTGATPAAPTAVNKVLEKHAPSVFPTANEIAMAIVLASRVLGADPIRVAKGEANINNDYSTSRARALAAFAIADRYDLPWRMIAKYVGASESVLMVVKGQRLKMQLKWWDERAFRELCADLGLRLA